MSASSSRPVIVTTEHRGVFFGHLDANADITAKTLALTDARMCIVWGTTKGLMQLCETGPTNNSKISAPADIPALHNVTAVFDVTPEAVAAFEAA